MTTKKFNGKAIVRKRNCKHSERVKSNGYYAVFKPDHPNAFGSGYVYEHRFIMEQHLGRFLLSTEIVHHKDKNKLNNDISNLELHSSIAEHKKEHRSVFSKVKRLPNEQNTKVKCDCGCNQEFLKYDDQGRERKYFSFGCVVRHKRIIRQSEQSKFLVPCACGCGQIITKFDQYGRIRKFISGHNGRHLPLLKAAGITRESLPSNCVSRDYNLFNQ